MHIFSFLISHAGCHHPSIIIAIAIIITIIQPTFRHEQRTHTRTHAQVTEGHGAQVSQSRAGWRWGPVSQSGTE